MGDDLEFLSGNASVIAERCANEGVPLGAIARILQRPFDLIAASVRTAYSLGAVGHVPKPDWPPGQHWDARLPTCPRTANADDVEFACKQQFRLTNLETEFLTVLLRVPCAEKEKLHGVIEKQRLQRPLRPDKNEATDPKMVDVVMCHLRKKMKNAGLAEAILTSHGRGYYVEPSMKEIIYARIGVTHGVIGPEPPSGRATVSAASA